MLNDQFEYITTTCTTTLRFSLFRISVLLSKAHVLNIDGIPLQLSESEQACVVVVGTSVETLQEDLSTLNYHHGE